MTNLTDADRIWICKEMKPNFTVFFQALIDNPKAKNKKNQADLKLKIYQVLQTIMTSELNYYFSNGIR
jgi:hypothetical protein